MSLPIPDHTLAMGSFSVNTAKKIRALIEIYIYIHVCNNVYLLELHPVLRAIKQKEVNGNGSIRFAFFPWFPYEGVKIVSGLIPKNVKSKTD